MLGIPDWGWAWMFLLLVVSFLVLIIVIPKSPDEPETTTEARPTNHYEIAASPAGECVVVYVAIDNAGPRYFPRRVCKNRVEAEAYMAECIHSDSVNAAKKTAETFVLSDGSKMPRERAEKVQMVDNSIAAKQAEAARKAKAADPSKHK